LNTSLRKKIHKTTHRYGRPKIFERKLEKEGLSSMARIRKELKFIETALICKAMKEVMPGKAQKAHRLGVTFFSSNLCIV
jgi:hypothetical protein